MEVVLQGGGEVVRVREELIGRGMVVSEEVEAGAGNEEDENGFAYFWVARVGVVIWEQLLCVRLKWKCV